MLVSDFAKFETFLQRRDFEGALALLPHISSIEKEDVLKWKVYCLFHSRKFEEVVDLLNKSNRTGEFQLYLACCYFHLNRFDEARNLLQEYKGPDSGLKQRLNLHLFGEENLLAEPESTLIQNKLSHASYLFKSGKFDEATSIYKDLLSEDDTNKALYVYLALCYYEQGYFDFALSNIEEYEKENQDSLFVTNLKAAICFRLEGGYAACKELKALNIDLDSFQKEHLLKHNLIVFSEGENEKTFEVFSSLKIPEAKVNLALYHIQMGQVEQAQLALRDIPNTSPHELAVKAMVRAQEGFKEEAIDLFEQAGNYDRDTVPGRQCMASALILKKEFDKANVFLESVQDYLTGDDIFNWNYGLSLAASGNFEEAEKILLQVKDEELLEELLYKKWLSRCFIHTGDASRAMDLYPSRRDQQIEFLTDVANECFLSKDFEIASKAFLKLKELDQDGDYYLGIKSSTLAALQTYVDKEVPSKYSSHIKSLLNKLQSHLQPKERSAILPPLYEWFDSLQL